MRMTHTGDLEGQVRLMGECARCPSLASADHSPPFSTLLWPWEVSPWTMSTWLTCFLVAVGFSYVV